MPEKSLFVQKFILQQPIDSAEDPSVLVLALDYFLALKPLFTSAEAVMLRMIEKPKQRSPHRHLILVPPGNSLNPVTRTATTKTSSIDQLLRYERHQRANCLREEVDDTSRRGKSSNMKSIDTLTIGKTIEKVKIMVARRYSS